MSIEFIGKSNFYSLSDMLQVESLIHEKLYYLQKNAEFDLVYILEIWQLRILSETNFISIQPP